MKKIFFKVVSVFLCLTVMFSTIAIGVSAEQDLLNETRSETTFSNKSGLDLIASNLTTGTENEDYVISYLEINGKTAYVDVNNIEECSLVVAIYEEKTMQMYASGITEVPVEHLEVEVEIDTEKMPEYYVVKAYLINKDYSPLCKAYESLIYTKAYEEFLKKTPDDFTDSEVVVFDETKECADFAVLTEAAIVTEYSGKMTFSFDEKTSTYTFYNALSDVKNLKIGDVYYYEHGTEANEFLLFKVKTINVSGTTVKIVQDENISIEEVFSFVRIDAQGDYDNIELDESKLGEALSIVDESTPQVFNNGGTSPELDYESGVERWSTELIVNWKIYENGTDNGKDDSTVKASISGTIKYEVSTQAKLVYDAVLFGKDYYEFKSETTHELGLDGIQVSGEITLPQDVVKIPIPDIPVGPFTLEINVAPVLEFSASVNFSILYITSTVITATKDNGLQKTQVSDSDLDLKIDDGFSIKIGLSIEFKLKLLEFLSLALNGDCGLQLDGTVDTVGVWLDKHHDCTACVNGEASSFVGFRITLGLKIIPEILDLSWNAVKWSKQWDLFDFYVSLSSEGFSCGKGPCKNKSYKVVFEVFEVIDGKSIKLEGANVSAKTGLCDSNGDGKFKETVTLTNSKGQAEFYFKSGEHTVEVSYSGYKIKKETFRISENSRTISIEFNEEKGFAGNENVGDIIVFGSYPQSKVTDEALLSKLNSQSLNWVSYGYYSGTGNWADGQMKSGDYMKYADIIYNNVKYRAVKFTEYRPGSTGGTTSADESNQDNSGYYINNVYWFKYEPLKWRVLDPKTGLIMCEKIIDAQTYNDIVYYNGTNGFFNGIGSSYSANNYDLSSINEWLNTTFCNAAFTKEESAQISEGEYRIFLLSADEARNRDYGFNPSRYDGTLVTSSTEYAQSQGMSSGNCSWITRTKGQAACHVTVITDSGYIYGYFNVNNLYGIRPVLRIKNVATEIETIEETVYSNGSMEESPSLFDVSDDSCIAGNDYFLLNVSNYSTNFELTSENLLFINQLTADRSGKVNTSFIPRVVNENSTTLLIGDFGKGVEIKKIVSNKVGTKFEELRLLNATAFINGETITIQTTPNVERAAIYSATFGGEKVSVEIANTPITVSSSKAYVLKFEDWHKSSNKTSTTMTIGDDVYTVNFVFQIDGDGHKYDSVTVPPTSTGMSYIEHTCSICGDSYYTDALYETTGDAITLNYKATGRLNNTLGDEYKVTYESSNPNVVWVDNNGNIKATGRGTAEVTITATFGENNTVIVTTPVTVTFAWWQWLIYIFLFGFIWY